MESAFAGIGMAPLISLRSLLTRDAFTVVLNLLRDCCPILQELRSGNDNVVAGLQSVEHGEIVANGFAKLQRFLARHGSFTFVDGNEREELAIDALHREHRNHRALM